VTPLQYRAAIKKLGLSQRQAAIFLDVSERTSRRYALGEVEIPGGIAKLLRLMVRLQLAPEDVD
jgi:transcriptional regulator with XRE-family HTH domain